MHHPAVAKQIPTRQAAAARSARRRAFTLIELLVVVTIIGILASIVFTVSTRFNQSAKARATENTLRGLDGVLAEYVLQTGRPPPGILSVKQGDVVDQRQDHGFAPLSSTDADAPLALPMVDGRVIGRQFPIVPVAPSLPAMAQEYDRDFDPPQPALSLFLVEALKYSSVQAMMGALGSSYVQGAAMAGWGWKDTDVVISQFDFSANGNSRPLFLPVVNDAWGRPIRFAHHAFQGGYGGYAAPGQPGLTTREQLKIVVDGTRTVFFERSWQPYDRATVISVRPVGDSDEGASTTNRAYFYSAGPDGNPGNRKENVYLPGARPEYPAETAAFSAD